MLIFLRHGKTDKNLQNMFQGHIDPPLNEEGMEEIRRSAELLRRSIPGIERFSVMSSPLKRAIETAEIISEELGIQFLGPTELLKEMNFGIFEGLTREEMLEKYGDIYEQFQKDKMTFRIPGGESFTDVLNRALEFVEKHGSKNIIAVTHGTYMKILYSHFLGEKVPPMDRFFHNGCFFTLEGKEVGEIVAP